MLLPAMECYRMTLTLAFKFLFSDISATLIRLQNMRQVPQPLRVSLSLRNTWLLAGDLRT